ARARKERVAVGLGLGSELGGDDAGGAGTVVDIELLAVLRRKLRGDESREHIGGLADREPEQDAHRLGGIVLRRGGGGESGKQDSGEADQSHRGYLQICPDNIAGARSGVKTPSGAAPCGR